MKNFYSLLLSLVLFGCGGSGNNHPYEGTWSGRLFLTEEDPVGCADRDFIDVSHIVSIEEEAISLDSDGFNFQGILELETEFETSWFVGSGISPISSEIKYTEISNNTAMAHYSIFQGVFTEADSSSCYKAYAGAVEK